MRVNQNLFQALLFSIKGFPDFYLCPGTLLRGNSQIGGPIDKAGLAVEPESIFTLLIFLSL